MGNRRIILVLLCGIALCSALLWLVQQRQRGFATEGKPKATLLDTTLDAVQRVTIERGDTRIGLARISGKWVLTAPFPAHVEQGAVARLLDAFEAARIKDSLGLQEIRKRELSLREFGLLPAHMQVTLEGPEHRDTFLFGSFTPLGDDVYLRVNGESRIVAVPSALHEAIPRTADDLRSRKLVRGHRESVRTLEVRSPGHPFITLSRDSDRWRLIQPVVASASNEKVEALLDLLYGARVSHFVWPTVSNVMDVAETEAAVNARMGLYGLGLDTGLQIYVQETGAAQPEKLTLGHPINESADLSYALLPEGDAIVAVSNSVVEAFRLSESDLRDTHPFSGSAASVRRLQVHLGDALFVLTQTNAIWRFEIPVADEADQTAVREMLERLLRLNAESTEERGAGPQTEGNHERNLPISHVELVTDQGAWRFLIEPDDFAGHFMNLIFTNTPTVFRVASSNVPPALVSISGLLGLRDKTVLALSQASLRRIIIKRNGEPPAAVERGGSDASWHLSEGCAGRIVPTRLNALITCLEDLPADRIDGTGLSPERFAAYGLREPWLELSVDVDAKDAVRKALLIGREASAGKRYAVVRGLDVLFVLGPATLEVLSARFVEPWE